MVNIHSLSCLLWQVWNKICIYFGSRFRHLHENASYHICAFLSAPISILIAYKNFKKAVQSARTTNLFFNRIGMRLIYEPSIRTFSAERVKCTSEVYLVTLTKIVPLLANTFTPWQILTGWWTNHIKTLTWRKGPCMRNSKIKFSLNYLKKEKWSW